MLRPRARTRRAQLRAFAAELERLGFFVCVADLEDELVRAVGPEGVEAVIAGEGELTALHLSEAAGEA